MSQHLLFGIGSDSYLIGFQENRTIDFVREYGFGVITNNAHSVPIQIGANFGVLAFLLYCFIMLKIFFLCIQELVRNNSLPKSNQSIYIFWIVLFLQSLLSIEQIGLGATTWILGAYILRKVRDKDVIELHSKRNSVARNEKSYGEVLLLLVVLFSLVLSIPYGQEDRARRNLIALETSGQSISNEDRDFINSQYSQITSMTLSEPILVRPVLEKLYAINNIEEIRRLSQELVKKNPRDYYAWEHLASYYQIVSDQGNLLNTLKIMISLDPVNVDVLLGAAKVSEQIGLNNEAKNLARRIVSIAPTSSQASEAQLLINEIDN